VRRRLLPLLLVALAACASDSNDARPDEPVDAEAGTSGQQVDDGAAPTGGDRPLPDEPELATDLSDRPGRLLVYEFENEERPLSVYSPNGETIAALPVTAGTAAWLPSWSPSGEWVVWAESPDNQTWVAARARPGSDDRDEVVLPGRPDHLAFAPSEDVVYLLTPAPGGFGLFSADFASPGEPREIDLGVPYFSDVGPTGDLLTHAGAETRVVTPDGTGSVLDDSGAGYQTPLWLADGHTVVYSRRLGIEEGSMNELVLHDLSNDEVRSLAHYRRFVFFALDPGSERLAVAVFGRPPAARFQTQEVRAVGPTATGTDELPQADTAELSTGLWLVPLDGSDPEQLSEEPSGAPSWDPTGEWIVARSTVGGTGEWRAHADDGRVRSSPAHTIGERGVSVYYLQFWDQYSRTQTIWAPDGSAYAYPALSGSGAAHIWIHDLATGESLALAPGSMAFWAPDPPR